MNLLPRAFRATGPHHRNTRSGSGARETLVQRGLPEQVLSECGCAPLPRASVDILRVGWRAPSEGSPRAEDERDESWHVDLGQICVMGPVSLFMRTVERKVPFTFCG